MSFSSSIIVLTAFMALESLAPVGCGDAAPETVPSMPSPTANVGSAQPTSVPMQPTATAIAVSVQPASAATGVSIQPTSVPTALSVRAEPAATEAEVDELVRGNSAFAFDLYRTLSEDDGNLFYSPYSISIALGMTYAGAGGETEQQMADTLHLRLPQDMLHPAFNSLFLDLDSRGGGANDNDPSAFRLNIANALWAREGYPLLNEFTVEIAENYGAAVRHTDFVGQPEESRLRINDWVAGETENRVEDLIPPGKLEDLPPALVLTNAIYFNAAWLLKFRVIPSPTDFHRLDGEAVAVPMMNRTDKTSYASGDGYQAVDLQYVFGRMSMTILLPDSGTFGAFEDSLDDELVAQIIEDLEIRHVVLTMPKFEFESKIDLIDTLSTMGMPNAFDPLGADFSGMDGRSCAAGDIPCLVISDVIHRAFVTVDEEGTEAAAATAAIVILESGAPGPPVEVIVDRPFIFLVRDGATGTILFVGRVLDPSA